MSEFREVVPGILHWRAFHERIRQDAHSYFLPDLGVAIDPMASEGLAEALAGRGGVELVVLTNRHHLRASEQLAAVFGCEILVPAAGMHEFDDGQPVRAYEWGERLAPGITAHEVGAICPDDGALHIEVGPGAIAFADGLIEWEGELAFVPDFLMDDPERVKSDQLDALRRLVERDFDAVLLAHGEPLPSGGKAALERFIAEPRQADFSG
jgi:glyoxylase-like metal-dependent hydrolase (beta-lactamase superfamily II)